MPMSMCGRCALCLSVRWLLGPFQPEQLIEVLRLGLADIRNAAHYTALSPRRLATVRVR
jgi:hypothetical protein